MMVSNNWLLIQLREDGVYSTFPFSTRQRAVDEGEFGARHEIPYIILNLEKVLTHEHEKRVPESVEASPTSPEPKEEKTAERFREAVERALLRMHIRGAADLAASYTLHEWLIDQEMK